MLSRIDTFSSILLILLSGFLWLSLGDVPQEVAYYPKAVLLGLVACSIALMTKSIRAGWTKQAPSVQPAGSKVSLSVFALFVLSMLYVVVLPYLGFITTTFMFLVFLMWMLRIRKWTLIVGVSTATILFIYFGFEKGLMVPLPDGYAVWSLFG